MIRTPRTLRRWKLCVTHRDQNPLGSVLHSSSPNCGTRFSDSLMPRHQCDGRWKATLILHSEIKCYLAVTTTEEVGKSPFDATSSKNSVAASPSRSARVNRDTTNKQNVSSTIDEWNKHSNHDACDTRAVLVDCPRTAVVQVRRDLAHSGQMDFS